MREKLIALCKDIAYTDDSRIPCLALHTFINVQLESKACHEIVCDLLRFEECDLSYKAKISVLTKLFTSQNSDISTLGYLIVMERKIFPSTDKDYHCAILALLRPLIPDNLLLIHQFMAERFEGIMSHGLNPVLNSFLLEFTSHLWAKMTFENDFKLLSSLHAVAAVCAKIMTPNNLPTFLDYCYPIIFFHPQENRNFAVVFLEKLHPCHFYCLFPYLNNNPLTLKQMLIISEPAGCSWTPLAKCLFQKCILPDYIMHKLHEATKLLRVSDAVKLADEMEKTCSAYGSWAMEFRKPLPPSRELLAQTHMPTPAFPGWDIKKGALLDLKAIAPGSAASYKNK